MTRLSPGDFVINRRNNPWSGRPQIIMPRLTGLVLAVHESGEVDMLTMKGRFVSYITKNVLSRGLKLDGCDLYEYDVAVLR